MLVCRFRALAANRLKNRGQDTSWDALQSMTPPPPPFLGSADSKGVAGAFFVSADSKRVRWEGRSFAGCSVRVMERLNGSGWLIETGTKPAGTRDWRGCSSIYTNEGSRKYRACQLIYWYRSNELWKNRRNPHVPRRGPRPDRGSFRLNARSGKTDLRKRVYV